MEPIDFWIWFANYRPQLEAFLKSDFSNYEPYETLYEQLKEYSEWLVPELTFDKNGTHVLIISCDGRQEGIPDAEALYHAFPVISGWNTQLYRQAGDFWGTNINGVVFQEEELLAYVQPISESDTYDIVLYIKDWEEEADIIETAALIYLDHCLGEYTVMMCLRYIAFAPLEASTEEALSLRQLRALIDFPSETE